MKLAVSGSRYCWCYEIVEKEINLLKLKEDIELIITGGATGIDTLAESYARFNKIPVKVYHAQWDKYGAKAGIIRNKLMVNECDMLLAFPAKNSVGTVHTINYCKTVGKPVLVKEL